MINHPAVWTSLLSACVYVYLCDFAAVESRRQIKEKKNTLTELIRATIPMQEMPQMMLQMASFLWLSLQQEVMTVPLMT